MRGSNTQSQSNVFKRELYEIGHETSFNHAGKPVTSKVLFGSTTQGFGVSKPSNEVKVTRLSLHQTDIPKVQYTTVTKPMVVVPPPHFSEPRVVRAYSVESFGNLRNSGQSSGNSQISRSPTRINIDSSDRFVSKGFGSTHEVKTYGGQHFHSNTQKIYNNKNCMSYTSQIKPKVVPKFVSTQTVQFSDHKNAKLETANFNNTNDSRDYKILIDKIFNQIHNSARHRLENDNPFNEELESILERTIQRTEARLKEKKILPENYGHLPA